MVQPLTPEVLQLAMSFDAYMELTTSIVDSPNPSGKYQNEKTHRYTRSNLERMNKILENMTISQKLYNQVSELNREWIWLVLSEPWCGDASWGVPALYLIATASEKIEFKILLRDTNLEVMNAYQTNGSNSIPKLICFRKPEMKELGTWGPRPKELQELVKTQMEQKDLDYVQGVRQLHAWYEDSLTNAIQDEFIDLVKEWKAL